MPEKSIREWFQENYSKKRMTFSLLSLRSALECMISGKFVKSWECMTFLLSLRSALGCVIWGKFLKFWECVISSTKSEKCVGSAWFQENAWSPRSALEVRSALLLRWWKCIGSALECVTNDRSAWKVRTSVQQRLCIFITGLNGLRQSKLCDVWERMFTADYMVSFICHYFYQCFLYQYLW